MGGKKPRDKLGEKKEVAVTLKTKEKASRVWYMKTTRTK